MGSSKHKLPIIKCKCPNCKCEYEMRLFLFDHNPKKIYPKYCSTCKANADKISSEYDIGDGNYHKHVGVSNDK